MLLQQDNARPHVERVTTQYLRQTNVNVMDDWPALSADLNPIEHCSDYLKKRIRKLQLTKSGTFRMPSEESGKDSRWVISDVW